jgi:hypothetical protein
MNAPKIMGMRGMFQSRGFPTGTLASAAGRRGSLVVWAKPADKRRVKTLANGARVIPNRGDVVLRGR